MRFSNESLCYRPFVKDDREACLEIMDSNIPEFILPYERDLFLTCLDENPYPYRVVEKPGQGVVACGGFAFEKKLTDEGKRIASMCWGMVHRTWHRRGLGRFLTLQRIRELLAEDTLARIRIDTSQKTAAFYEKFGFCIIKKVRGGYGPGLDRYDMEVALGDAERESLSGMIESGGLK